jgi:hypothetical protein
MTVIGALGAVGFVGGGVSRPAAESVGFAVRSGSAARPRGAESADSLGAVALGGLLGLQEMESTRERDRRARRHGQDMLAALAMLQRALTGTDPNDALERLAILLRTQAPAADPALAATLAAISLRVRVELARRSLVL